MVSRENMLDAADQIQLRRNQLEALFDNSWLSERQEIRDAWTDPHLVDIQLCHSTSGLTFIFYGRHVPDARMQSLAIIENLDVVEHLETGDLARTKCGDAA
jgi:hypothetical protein